MKPMTRKCERVPLCVCTHVLVCVCLCTGILDFYLFLTQTSPGKHCNSLFPSCGVSSSPSCPCRLSPLSSLCPLSWGPGALAGSSRLQQILTAADPLAIQADVHWTHIREREAEERMLPTSESSTSRGNCILSTHSQTLPQLQRPRLLGDPCP